MRPRCVNEFRMISVHYDYRALGACKSAQTDDKTAVLGWAQYINDLKGCVEWSCSAGIIDGGHVLSKCMYGGHSVVIAAKAIWLHLTRRSAELGTPGQPCEIM
jgi:hypothetical protein